LTKQNEAVRIRKARITDVEAIRALVMNYAQKQLMLPRSLRHLYDNLRNFFVAVSPECEVVGCGALQVSWQDLAEVKSIAVREDWQGRGVGRRLVQVCLGEAAELHVPRVFALSFAPEFFERMGFHRIDKNELPHKVWTECVDCPLFPECGETALAIDVRLARAADSDARHG
jgi:amino-acid N-acetyltransferase